MIKEPKITLYVHHETDEEVSCIVIEESLVESKIHQLASAPIVIACNPYSRTNTFYEFGEFKEQAHLSKN